MSNTRSSKSKFYLHGPQRRAVFKSVHKRIEEALKPSLHQIVSIKVDGKYVVHARVVCAECAGHHAVIPELPDAPSSMIARQFRQLGWKIDDQKPDSVRCPSCVKAANEAINCAIETVRRANEQTLKLELKEPAAMTAPATVSTLNPTPRKLVPDEKLRVRNVLDKQFDEAKGAYLDGYSDQRVGEETNVPWASVRELREVAYGPLRSVPELETLRAETERVAAAAKALEKLAGDLSRRITEATRRLGVEDK